MGEFREFLLGDLRYIVPVGYSQVRGMRVEVLLTLL